MNMEAKVLNERTEKKYMTEKIHKMSEMAIEHPQISNARCYSRLEEQVLFFF
jgi:hypothetical protein